MVWDKGCEQPHLAEMKARQAAKMRELREILVADGMHSVDEQANVLGLSRSTTWSILSGNHKASGLSASTVNRILAAPQLSPRLRKAIFEYVEEKVAGTYGHSEILRRRFVNRLGSRHQRIFSKKLREVALFKSHRRANGSGGKTYEQDPVTGFSSDQPDEGTR